jgi:hypothetical protein
MLGTAHILMIRHGLYASLPHRRGEGGTGTMTDPRQELRRQLRFVRRNLELIANLVRLRANLPIDSKAHTRLLHQQAKLRARLLTHRQSAVIRSEAPNNTSIVSEALKSVILTETHNNFVILSKAKDLQFASVAHIASRERQRSEPNESRHRRVRLGRPVRKRPKEASPATRPRRGIRPCGKHRGTLLARGNALP